MGDRKAWFAGIGGNGHGENQHEDAQDSAALGDGQRLKCVHSQHPAGVVAVPTAVAPLLAALVRVFVVAVPREGDISPIYDTTTPPDKAVRIGSWPIVYRKKAPSKNTKERKRIIVVYIRGF